MKLKDDRDEQIEREKLKEQERKREINRENSQKEREQMDQVSLVGHTQI